VTIPSRLILPYCSRGNWTVNTDVCVLNVVYYPEHSSGSVVFSFLQVYFMVQKDGLTLNPVFTVYSITELSNL